MNCCGGPVTEQDKTNKQISDQLKKDRKIFDNEIRLLLLGAGESGKSTIAKQMKIIHMNGFSKTECAEYLNAIHTNIWESLQNLAKACSALEGAATKNPKNKEFSALLSQPFSGKITLNLKDDIKNFWNDEGVQAAYKRRNEFQLNDSCEYYLCSVDRILTESYVPTEQDVLRSRIQTTGIIETSFNVEGKKFTIVDVGGQRSERKKWMHCFEDVTGVLFCVGISAFDQTLYEDNVTNRLHEALKLFHEICKSKWFSNTLMILFLNKEDIFRQKIESGKSIKTAFPDYDGPNDFESQTRFLEKTFTNVIDPTTGSPKEIYTHVTCATNTENVRVVFEAVRDFILNKALQGSGLV
jgi:GTPase SAR1 family protein